MVDINTLTVRQFRAYITARGGDARGCVEKGDLRTLASSLAGDPDLSVKVCAECKAPAKTVCPDCQMLTYCGRSCAASDMGHQAVECPLTRRVREGGAPDAQGDGPPGARTLPYVRCDRRVDPPDGSGSPQRRAVCVPDLGADGAADGRSAVGAHRHRLH